MYPDKWVVVSIPDNEYKVFGSTAGGYLYGDSWRLNSGIVSVSVDDDYYHFEGYSGSTYVCSKKGYGVAGASNAAVLANLLEDFEGQMTLMPEGTDWLKLLEEKL